MDPFNLYETISNFIPHKVYTIPANAKIELEFITHLTEGLFSIHCV